MMVTNKFFAAIIAVILAFAIISCEGPAGEDGLAGIDGKDGKDGQEQCGVCHNSSTLLFAKQIEWDNSQHGMGTSYSYAGGRTACAPCHANEAYRVWVETGDFAEAQIGINTPTPVGCYTCHEVHETYTVEDYALRGTEKFNLMGDMTDNLEVDFGKGNQCAKCHQTRSRNYGLDPAAPDAGNHKATGHWGPHYGTQANTIAGAGGYETGGGTYGSTVPHQKVADGCVSCHVGDGDHTFSADIASCSGCHSDIESLDYRGFQTTIAGLIAELEGALVAEGLLAIDIVGEKGHATDMAVDLNNDKAGAIFNYYLVYDDGSLGVHNPRYIKALLEKSINVFK